ncbi:hypothetical protein JHK85_003662 [Glycine max]|nr:hypothetical protein JHK85_003662 [Glycine max]KAG5079426.1 hypothetical protein JHK86_003491 [Glycine max]
MILIEKPPTSPTPPLSSPFVLRSSWFKVEAAAGSQKNNSNKAFDAAAFEAERLALDAESRRAMAEAAYPKAWKWVIRKRIWDVMEARNFANNPRPVHHRIPNFVGASVAAEKMRELDVFQVAQCVKVNPDSPQKQVRFLTLSDGKKLLTPQPRPRTGFFSVLDSNMLTLDTIKEACTSVGVAKHGQPIGLDKKIKVDLIVIGSVAVDPRTGIYWDKLSPEKLGQIRILREFKKRIEQETGQKLPTGPSEKLPPIAQRSRRG